MKCYEFIIKGIVQGVGFRWFVKQRALNLNIKGFVKNLSNGDVLVIACGEEKDILELLRICKHGYKFARVDKVLHRKLSAQEIRNFNISKEFEIRL